MHQTEDLIQSVLSPRQTAIIRLQTLKDVLNLSGVPGDDRAAFASEILRAIATALEKPEGSGGNRKWVASKTDTCLSYSCGSFAMWVEFGEDIHLEMVRYTSTGFSEDNIAHLWAWVVSGSDESERYLRVMHEHLLWAEAHK